MSLIILIMFSKLTPRALSFIAMSLTRGSRLLPVVITCTQTFVNAQMSLNMAHSILHSVTLVLPISLSQKTFWMASSAAFSSSVMSISSIMLQAVSKGTGAAREVVEEKERGGEVVVEHVEERVLHAWPSEPVSVRTVRPVSDCVRPSSLSKLTDVSISVPTLRRVAAVRRACLGRDLEDSRRCKA